MSAISKYWYEIVTPAVTCESLTHPGLTCGENLGIQLRKTVPGNLQFFGPISVLRMVLLMYTRNQVSWAVVLQALYECGMAALNGWFVSNSWTAMFCVLYRLLGQRFVNNWSVSLPALAGTLAMFWMPPYVKMSHSRAIFNVFLECWIKSREHWLLEWARESKTAGTVAFMGISAAIGYFAQRTKLVEFWFFSPLKKNLNPPVDAAPEPCSSTTPINPTNTPAAFPQKSCYHRHACYRYILDGMKTCFTFGMVLELARKLIAVAPVLRKQPSALLSALARMRYKFVAFLTLYNGLFRVATCILARTRGKVIPEDSTLAGFISGLTYALSPNYNVFNLAVAAMLQNVWNFTVEGNSKVQWLQRINSWSLASIVWVFLMNYNMYSRAYYPYAMSKFALKFTDICSAAQARVASKNLAKFAMGAS
ncbi:uncharacterized protein LOC120419702 isoform X2 [Culex pipiens pallens]|uniref:uncharacterized protein LOC120419702 isoform X2 n=1 Tax=Culex pipiens pallens TaxID=42434 RepID=UPI0022AA3C32|nr:uncharacterized protein LOC120419702 isoform X2 [Culex pipiens pallens]